MKQKKNSRDYNYSDPKMVVKAGVIARLFGEDQVDFVNYSAVIFHTEYLNDFKIKIHKVYTELSDKEIKKNLARHTQDVEDCIEEVTVAHNGIMIIAEIAFKGDDITLEQMGKGKLTEIKESHNSFQFNMSRIAMIFDREMDKLEQAGCTPERIEAFQVLCNKLITLHENQENYKITRRHLTQQRITLLNEIYAVIVLLHEVAQNIWVDDPEYAKRYDLPQTSSNGSDEDLFDDEEVEKEIEEMMNIDPVEEE